MNRVSRLGVPKRGVLIVLSVGSAVAAMAVSASPALASDTSGLTLKATAEQGAKGAPLTLTYKAPANSPAALSAATLALPISWNAGLTTVVNTGSAVGTVTITPPGGAPLVGQITVTDQNDNIADRPTMVVTFPSSTSGGTTVPGFALTGALDLTNHTVAFTGFPNVPFTSFVLSLSPGPTSPASIKCQTTPGTVTTTVSGQDGTSNQLSAPLLVTDCPPAVTSAKLTRAGRGTAALHFSVAATDGGIMTLLTVRLPVGLSFVSAEVHKGARGVTIRGGKVSTVVGVSRKLTVMLTAPTSKLIVELRANTLKLAKALQTQLNRHKTVSLSGRLDATAVSSELI